MKFQRSTYIINPRFQFKISLFLSSLVFILSLAYPLTIYTLFQSLVSQSSLQETSEAFSDNRLKIIATLATYHLAFIGIIFVICMFQAHKIAGPMYKLVNFLKTVSSGEKIEKVQFRKDDHFQEVAESVNEAFDYLKNNYNKDFAYLSEINSYVKNISLVVPEDKKIVLREISSKLDDIQARFKTL